MQSKRPKPELLYGMSTRDYEHFMMQFSSNDHNGDGAQAPLAEKRQ